MPFPAPWLTARGGGPEFIPRARSYDWTLERGGRRLPIRKSPRPGNQLSA